MNKESLAQIVKQLLEWYHMNARSMPWRDDPTPYKVWVSEIMLQQTRVEAGRAYFLRWIEALPDVESLANVEDSKLMKLWEGLGYYNRARNLKKAAGVVIEQYSGKIPDTYEQLLALPGIGPYTAGAIGSIAFQLPVPAVDGNVLRVIARLTGDRSDISSEAVKRCYSECIASVLPTCCPGDFNQALMELGALICIPNGAPRCSHCPLSEQCVARQTGTTTEIPAKKKKSKRKITERTIFVLKSGNCILLRKREKKGLLAGQWELPGIDRWLSDGELDPLLESWGYRIRSVETLPPARHIFSHVEWRMKAYKIETEPCFFKEGDALWICVDEERLSREIALPSAFNAFRPSIF